MFYMVLQAFLENFILFHITRFHVPQGLLNYVYVRFVIRRHFGARFRKGRSASGECRIGFA
jgi:hypothetical protein